MNIYKRYRFPSVIIQHAVWLYHRFNLSHRDIDDLLANAELQSAMKLFDCGVISLDLNMQKD
jgi:transposase-like protein